MEKFVHATRCVPDARGWNGVVPACGFTLVELVIVVVLAAVVSIFVAPKFLGSGDYYSRGFHDETLALLRYAQKAAIVQRRPVCVFFSSNSASLKIDADRSAGTGTNGCEANLAGPRGDTPGQITARGTVQYSSVPSTVVFDGLGQPASGQTIQVVGAANQITIESVTGYVHE